MSYGQDQLKSAGFSIKKATTVPHGGMVMAEDCGKNRSLKITARLFEQWRPSQLDGD